MEPMKLSFGALGNAIDLLFLASESVGIEESFQPILTHGFRTCSLPRF